MKTQQLSYKNSLWSVYQTTPNFQSNQCQLVFIFGANEIVSDPTIYNHVYSQYPNANIVSASTAGEIIDKNVFDNTAVVTAIEFNSTQIRCVKKNITEHASSEAAGKFLMNQFPEDGLKSVFIISDGTKINGSELVLGINANTPKGISVSGGLAGDAARFLQTSTGLNSVASEGNLIAIGFYGNNIKVGHGSFGGWDEFGKERKITKANKNVLYEIDGKSALSLYKEYLGPFADELPGSALLFPLSLKLENSEKNLVRTILSIDEKEQSMTFAGNMPEGSTVRLMKANFQKLVEGASSAANYAIQNMVTQPPQLAILISCVGRKLVLQSKTFEEVEAAKNIIGKNATITGFYSYGEISPMHSYLNCDLHNQTMTITTFTEF